GLSLNLLPLDEKHLMNLNTRSRTIEVYSLKANGVFEIIDTFSSHRIVDPIFHWKYLMNEDSKELLYIETENGLALRPLNLIGEWRVITNDSLYLIKGKKLKIVQKDSQGNFTDFWETQLDEVIDSINSLKLFENRYLVVKYGHYSKVIDIHSDNSQWIKIDLMSIAGFREIQNGDFRHIVFYSSVDNRLSILTTSPFHKISVTNIEHEKNTRSNELVNILSHQSLSIEKNILNLGDSFHLRLYDLDSWN
ncbi:MAG: hypothetical protein VX642_15495, partial [Bdellovibrionota bacterium]|nr:hypothetical protein [Bdellovibrionota bacterium]